MNIINTILFIGLGGFIGANLRYLIGVYINKYSHEMTGTLIVNITGSFLNTDTFKLNPYQVVWLTLAD